MAKAKKSGLARDGISKCPTGVHGLDGVTFGDLPRGRPTIVCGGASCGKTLLGMEYPVRGATQYNEPGVCVSFEETGEELAQNMRSLGFDLHALISKKKLAIDYVHIERTLVEETVSTTWRRYSFGSVKLSTPLERSASDSRAEAPGAGPENHWGSVEYRTCTGWPRSGPRA